MLHAGAQRSNKASCGYLVCCLHPWMWAALGLRMGHVGTLAVVPKARVVLPSPQCCWGLHSAGPAVPLVLCQPCTRLLLGTGAGLLPKVVARCGSPAVPSSTAAAPRPAVLPGPGTQLCCSATVGAAAPAPVWAVAGVPARVGAAGREGAVRATPQWGSLDLAHGVVL